MSHSVSHSMCPTPYLFSSMCVPLPVRPTPCISRSCVSHFISVSPLCIPSRVSHHVGVPLRVHPIPCASQSVYFPLMCLSLRACPNYVSHLVYVPLGLCVPTICPISRMSHSVCVSPLGVPSRVYPTRYVSHSLGVCPTRCVFYPMCVLLGIPGSCVSHSVYLSPIACTHCVSHLVFILMRVCPICVSTPCVFYSVCVPLRVCSALRVSYSSFHSVFVFNSLCRLQEANATRRLRWRKEVGQKLKTLDGLTLQNKC